MGHANAAQTNATPIDGPVGETRSLNADEIQYQDMGSGSFRF